MPYDLRWQDEDSGLLALRLYDPLEAADAEVLIDELRGILETLRPVFMLLDLTQLDAMRAMSNLRDLGEGQVLPRGTAMHLERSRLAVVGGGSAISMILALVNSLSGHSPVRAFQNEDEATLWLEEAAAHAAGAA